jgi:hypothetical protein
MTANRVFDSGGFAPQRQVAVFLGLSERTMERLRLEGRGPAFHKFGRRVMYRWRDDLEWADAQRRDSTSDSGERSKPDTGDPRSSA